MVSTMVSRIGLRDRSKRDAEQHDQEGSHNAVMGALAGERHRQNLIVSWTTRWPANGGPYHTSRPQSGRGT